MAGRLWMDIAAKLRLWRGSDWPKACSIVCGGACRIRRATIASRRNERRAAGRHYLPSSAFPGRDAAAWGGRAAPVVEGACQFFIPALQQAVDREAAVVEWIGAGSPQGPQTAPLFTAKGYGRRITTRLENTGKACLSLCLQCWRRSSDKLMRLDRTLCSCPNSGW